MNHSSNDNRALTTPTIDTGAHGQAAILLVESLIHGLIEKSALSVEGAVEIVDDATHVSRDMALDLEEASPRMQGSITLLEAISKSLSHDLRVIARP